MINFGKIINQRKFEMDREKIADKVIFWNFPFAHRSKFLLFSFDASKWWQTQSSVSLFRDDSAQIYLCAPWPLNDDGSTYGIDTFQFDFETNDWQRRLVVDFNESNAKYGFGCACVSSNLFVLGGERCLEVYGRLKFDTFDEVIKSENHEDTIKWNEKLTFRWNCMTSKLVAGKRCPVYQTADVHYSG